MGVRWVSVNALASTHPDFASLVDPLLLRKKEGEGSYCKSISGLSVLKSVFLQETLVL